MGQLFHDMAERLNRRALIFILSDMFDEVNEVLLGLQHLRHKRHEVILWHTLDGAELTFPFQEPTLFRGLEAYPELLTDPRSLAKLSGTDGCVRRSVEARLPQSEHRLRPNAHRHAAQCGPVELSGALITRSK